MSIATENDSIRSLSSAEKQEILDRIADIKAKRSQARIISDKMKFSLFFFSDRGYLETDKYGFVFKCAQFADENEFDAIWCPERHFHEFGGPYPNPSVLMAAVAARTKNIKLRAGSIVAPLHHPARIAEEWSIVDNISHGRVGLSFASGWNRDDFILSQSIYESRKDIMFESIESVQSLWKGEIREFQDNQGHVAKIKLYPKPIQKELPVWVTSAANPETWKKAGEIGANILTGLMEQSVEELSQKINIYKKSLHEHGYNTAKNSITVMLHTYVGEDTETTKDLVKPALMGYLKNHLSLYEKQLNHAQNSKMDLSLITDADKQTLLEHGFERYFTSSSLLGDIDKTNNMIMKLKMIGVTEVACLINFGLKEDYVFAGLQQLHKLKCIQ